MKRIFFLLSAVVVSLTMAAQMQVWSNGTIIFSHDQTDVDSISFGNPMQVQANYNALSSTSLAGSVYTTSLSGGEYGSMEGLFFFDATTGFWAFNFNYVNNTGFRPCYNNESTSFTYSISGDDITLSMGGRTIHGKIIGKNGLVFSDFYKDTSNNLYPAVFVTLNR